MESQAVGFTTRVYVRPADVTTRLNALALTREALSEAVRFGASHAAECTGHDPSSLAGTLLWGKTTRWLRDQLIPLGWNARSQRNLPVTVHPSGKWAITVVSGDEGTGIPRLTPATRYDRGPATRQVVSRNQLTFSAWSDGWAEQVAALAVQTWFLLHYRDEDADEVRVELSLPSEMTQDGSVIGWRERIILGMVGEGQDLAPHVPYDSIDADADAIDIPVLRKA